MKYWKLIDSNRVIAIKAEIKMTPRWIQISKDEFDKLVLLRKPK